MLARLFLCVLVALVLGSASSARAQTALSPGDIAIVGIHTDPNDGFAFVALVPLDAGTEIRFTDNGWLAAGGFRLNENRVSWIAPAGGVAAGTVVVFECPPGAGVPCTVNVGSANTLPNAGSTALSGLSDGGEQLFAYQGTEDTPAFVYGLNDEGAGVWQDDATSSSTSALPPTLVNGQSAFALLELDNYAYTGPTTGTQAELLAAIATQANWTGDNVVKPAFPTSFLVGGGGGVEAASVAFVPASATVTEGAAATTQITLTIANDTGAPGLDTAVSGTVVVPAAYAGDVSFTAAFSFPVGTVSGATRALTITTVADSDFEGSEIVPFSFSDLTGATGAGPFRLTINDDEGPSGVNFAQIGFSTMDALGQNGTTGGAGGTVVTVTTGQQLRDAIHNNASNAPLTIYVQGMLTYTAEDVVYIKDRSNISVIGLGSDAGLDAVGFAVVRASNIIIRNLTIRNVRVGNKDAILIDRSTHVWVDHNDFYSDLTHGADYYDGLVDVSHGSDFITISWNTFHDHHKASLVGHSDNNGPEDIGHLRVTYHHNYFYNVGSRLPSLRFGTGHVFNNYYRDVVNNGVTAGTAVSSRIGACVRVEENVFENVTTPILTDQSGASELGAVDLVNNDFGSSVNVVTTPTCVLAVPYAYTDALQANAEVPATVMTYAGVGRLGGSFPTATDAPGAAPALALAVAPNPTAGRVVLTVTLPRPDALTLDVFDVLGRRVQAVADGSVLGAGTHRLEADLRRLSPGVYVVVARSGAQSVSRRVTVLG